MLQRSEYKKRTSPKTLGACACGHRLTARPAAGLSQNEKFQLCNSCYTAVLQRVVRFTMGNPHSPRWGRVIRCKALPTGQHTRRGLDTMGHEQPQMCESSSPPPRAPRLSPVAPRPAVQVVGGRAHLLPELVLARGERSGQRCTSEPNEVLKTTAIHHIKRA